MNELNATPHAELIAELMNPNNPKNECEHAAVREIERLREALTQPEQEPVAWINSSELLVMKGNAYAGAKDWRVNLGLEPEKGDVGLYTTQPQRPWVGLTEEELYEIYDESDDGSSPCGVCGACSKCKIEVAIARAIESKIKEKNR